MKIPLRELPCQRTVSMGAAEVDAVISVLPVRQALGEDGGPAGEAAAVIDLYVEGDNVFARGSLRGWLEVACSRCLEPVRLSVDESLFVSYLPRHQVPDDDDDVDSETVTEDDLDLYPYDQDEIDLAPLLRERVILAVPFAPLCGESCKGLCPSCGTNRNHSACDCDSVGDPRLAALKKIKV